RRARGHRRVRGPALPGQLEPRDSRAPPGAADLPRRAVTQDARARRRDRGRCGPLALLARLRAGRRGAGARARARPRREDARRLRARRGRAAGDLGRRARRSRRLPRRARALSHLAVLPRDARRQRPREGTRRLRSQRRSGRGADPRGRRRRQARGGPGGRARVPRGRRGAARNPPEHLPWRPVVSPDARRGRALVRCAVVLAALLAAGCATGRVEEARTPPDLGARTLPVDHSAAVRYVALGDSTVEGVGATRAKFNYVRRLHERLSAVYPAARVTNLGVGGATSADVLRRQVERAIELRPHLVTLSIGPNDITTQVGVAEYERNVDT